MPRSEIEDRVLASAVIEDADLLGGAAQVVAVGRERIVAARRR